MEKAFKDNTEYRRPVGTWIGRNEETERLYELEEKRDKAFKAAAKELQQVLKFDSFWREALPEAILSFLEGWDREAAVPAAEVYLEKVKARLERGR